MTINLIRHGKTAGNIEKRYIGRTDEPLCDTGIDELRQIPYPDCELVISSPMKRCLQTASIIYSGKRIVTSDDLRECDFGDFEGRNFIELSDNETFRKWVENGGLIAFPNGENSMDFRKRCVSGFLNIKKLCPGYRTVSFVIHGGTIMSILERFAIPKKGFYDYSIENGHGFVTEYDEKNIIIIDKI